MKGFLLDLNRCTGCHACTLACGIENNLGVGNSWRQVITFNAAGHPGITRFHLSLACMHCSDPACVTACPASAYGRDPATGAVMLDPARCIGCRYCSWACPFDAPRYDRWKGTVSKCTLCTDRLLQGLHPACTTLCPTGALQFAELSGGNGHQDIAGFPETALGPAMRFKQLRHGITGPELTAFPERSSATQPFSGSDNAVATKISIESEWSLVFFSLAAALLAAIGAAAFAGAIHIDSLDFLIAAFGTCAVSVLHLGKWRRAWRAVLHLRASWLSREVALFSAFSAFTTILLYYPVGTDLLHWPVALTGFGALFCIDQVYEQVSGNRWLRLHSARTLLTGLFLFGILAGQVAVAALTGLLKLVLYSYRQSWFQGRWRALASGLRLGLGFVAPLAFWRQYPDWVLPLVLIAEVIDRCEYYLDLDIPTPRAKIAADLRQTLARNG